MKFLQSKNRREHINHVHGPGRVRHKRRQTQNVIKRKVMMNAESLESKNTLHNRRYWSHDIQTSSL